MADLLTVDDIDRLYQGGPEPRTMLRGPEPQGLVEPGNINLDTRPTVRNPDGTISTVRSMSFNENGVEVLVPTVSEDGRVLSPQDAIAEYRRTRKHLGKFKTPAFATTYAKQLHEEQAGQYGQGGGSALSVPDIDALYAQSQPTTAPAGPVQRIPPTTPAVSPTAPLPVKPPTESMVPSATEIQRSPLAPALQPSARQVGEVSGEPLKGRLPKAAPITAAEAGVSPSELATGGQAPPGAGVPVAPTAPIQAAVRGALGESSTAGPARGVLAAVGLPHTIEPVTNPNPTDEAIRMVASQIVDLPLMMVGGIVGAGLARKAIWELGLRPIAAKFATAGKMISPGQWVEAADWLVRGIKAAVGASSGAGALGLEDAVRAGSDEAVKDIEAKQAGPVPVSTSQIVGAAAKAAAKGGARGAALGGLTFGLSSQVPPGLIRTMTEAGIFGTAGPPITEGRAPTVQDLINAGVQIGAIALGFHLLGLRPEPQLQKIIEAGTPEASIGARATRVGQGETEGARRTAGGRPAPTPPPPPVEPAAGSRPAPESPPPAPAAPTPEVQPQARPDVPAVAPEPAQAAPVPPTAPERAPAAAPPMPAEADLKSLVESGGGVWKGVQKVRGQPTHVVVDEPTYGSTLYLPLKGLTSDTVRGALDAKRQVFERATPPQPPTAPATQSGPVAPSPAEAPPSLGAYGRRPPSEPSTEPNAKGFTRTGTVDYGQLPDTKAWPRGVYTTGGDAGRVVGEDTDNLYVAHQAGSMARVAKYPKDFIERNQDYWKVGATIQTREGAATITESPRLNDQGYRTLGVRLENGTEKKIPARAPFVTDMPMPGQPVPSAAVAPTEPIVTPAAKRVSQPPEAWLMGRTQANEAAGLNPRDAAHQAILDWQEQDRLATTTEKPSVRWQPKSADALPPLASLAQSERIARAAADLLNALDEHYGGQWPAGIATGLPIARFRREMQDAGLRRVPRGSNLEREAKRWVMPVTASKEVGQPQQTTTKPAAPQILAAAAPVTTTLEESFRNGVARAPELYPETRDYDRVLAGVSEALNGRIDDPDQATRAILAVANRWHEPLASLSGTAPFESVVTAMESLLQARATSPPKYDAERILRMQELRPDLSLAETRTANSRAASELRQALDKERSSTGSITRTLDEAAALDDQANDVFVLSGQKDTPAFFSARDRAREYRDAVSRYEERAQARIQEFEDAARTPSLEEVLKHLDSPTDADRLAVRITEELSPSVIENMLGLAYVLDTENGLSAFSERVSPKARTFITSLDQATLAEALRIVGSEDGVARNYGPRSRQLRASDLEKDPRFDAEGQNRGYKGRLGTRPAWGTGYFAEFTDPPPKFDLGSYDGMKELPRLVKSALENAQTVQPIARQWSRGRRNQEEVVYLRHPDGALSAVNAKFWDHLSTRHPGAETIQADPSSAVVFREGGKPTAIVMPMRVGRLSPAVQALVDRAGGGPSDISLMATGTEPLAPPFFSALSRAIEDRMPTQALPMQIGSLLKSPGVKAEEVKWSGIEDWLASKKGQKVTKTEVLDFLRANEVKVEEVIKGGDEATRQAIKQAERRVEDLHGALGRELVRAGVSQLDVANWPWQVREGHLQASSLPNAATREIASQLIQAQRDLSSARQGFLSPTERAELDRLEARIADGTITNVLRLRYNDLYDRLNASAAGKTKFGRYVLPGAEPGTYRELLLTLPPRSRSQDITVRPITEGERPGFEAVGPDGRVLVQAPTEAEARAEGARWLAQSEGEAAYRSPHWDTPNVLAHVRFNDRVDAEGKRVLFLEEVQSDYAQEARRKGIQGSGEETLTSEEQELRDLNAKTWTGIDLSASEETRRADLQHRVGVSMHAKLMKGGVPAAPFISTTEGWVGLALKRMLRYAAEHGYEKLAWTSGQIQAERYDLSKQIKSLRYFPRSDGVYDLAARTLDNQAVDIATGVEPDKLDQYVGKDMAQKILNREGTVYPSGRGAQEPSWREFTGLGLKVGAPGMTGFYDRILPEFLSKYGKKWGARVERTEIATDKYATASYRLGRGGGFDLLNARGETVGSAPTEAIARRVLADASRVVTTVPSIPITPSMRQSVLQEGQPLFMPRPRVEFGLPSDRVARAEQAIVHRFGEVSPRDPSNASFLSPTGRLVGDRSDHGETARTALADSRRYPRGPSEVEKEAADRDRTASLAYDIHIGADLRSGNSLDHLVEDLRSAGFLPQEGSAFIPRSTVETGLPSGTRLHEFDNPAGHFFQVVREDGGAVGLAARTRSEAIQDARRQLDRERASTVQDVAVRQELSRRFQRALQAGVPIPGEGRYRVADTAEWLRPEQIQALADSPYLGDLGRHLDDALDTVLGLAGYEEAGLGQGAYLYGFSPDPTYFGVNQRISGSRDAIALNPWALARSVQSYIDNGLIDESQAPTELARLMLRTLTHEATHVAVRQHGSPFEVEFALNVERTRDALRDAEGRLAAGLAGEGLRGSGTVWQHLEGVARTVPGLVSRARGEPYAPSSEGLVGGRFGPPGERGRGAPESRIAASRPGAARQSPAAGVGPEADLRRGGEGAAGELPGPALMARREPEPRTDAEYLSAGWKRVSDARGRAFYDRRTAEQLARDLGTRGDQATVEKLNRFIFTTWAKPAEAPEAPPLDRAAWARQAATVGGAAVPPAEPPSAPPGGPVEPDPEEESGTPPVPSEFGPPPAELPIDPGPANPPTVDGSRGAMAGVFNPNVPSTQRPQLTYLQRLRRRIVNKFPQDLSIARRIPDSPVISAIERHSAILADDLERVIKLPFHDRIVGYDEQQWIEFERQAVERWHEGGETEEAYNDAAESLPEEFQDMLAYRASQFSQDQAARRSLGLPPLPERAEPYFPRLTDEDYREVVRFFHSASNLGADLQQGVKSFQKDRVFDTMAIGQANGIVYEDPRLAWMFREWNSIKLQRTAELMESLKGTVLFDTRSEALSASPTGEVLFVEGLPGKPQRWWVRSREEALFLRDNLVRREGGLNIPGIGNATYVMNQLFRNPNLYNPLPHFLRNMLYKYGLATLSHGGNPLRVASDMVEFFRGSDPAEFRNYRRLMAWSRSGRLAYDILHEAMGRGPLDRTLKVFSLLNRPSSRVIFQYLDPALRYADYKAYRRQGVEPQEAANKAWIDLIRYSTRSELVDSWKQIPGNFYVPWRIGTVTSLTKALLTGAILSATFILGVDLLREWYYRSTGNWLHLPIDYVEKPVALVLEKPLSKEAWAVAATSAIFGPGGEATARLIADSLKGISDPADRQRLINAFWGISQAVNMTAEIRAYIEDREPQHLVNVLTSAALGTHAAVSYRPKRILSGDWLPTWLSDSDKIEALRNFGKSPEVLYAEHLQDLRQRKRERETERKQRKQGSILDQLGKALDKPEGERQLEQLKRGAGRH